MADYDFYLNTYLGSAISEKEFPVLAARAGEYLAMFRRKLHVAPAGEETEKLALCAMAECLHGHNRFSGVRSESVGSVSVTYSDRSARTLARSMLESAMIYLDISRGVD